MSAFALSAEASGTPPRVRTGFGPATGAALIALPLMFAGLLGWAALTPLNGAVVTSGQVSVPGQNRKLQHLDGGIVARILVKDGDRVTQGQPLVALDPTTLEASLGIARAKLAEAMALSARLSAEAAEDGAAEIPAETGIDADGGAAPDALRRPPLTLAALLALPGAAALGPEAAPGGALDRARAGQDQIRQARAQLLASQQAQTAARTTQLAQTGTGLEGAIAATEGQITLVDRELADLRTLAEKGLVQRSRLFETERTREGLAGQLTQQKADRAANVSAIREAEFDLARTENTRREQIGTDLRDANHQIEEQLQQIADLSARLERVVMRAPITGTVHAMTATTIGGVISPGETVAEIVPSGEGLEFDLTLDPRSVDQVEIGQEARLTFPAFDRARTPQITGHVTEVSASTVEDPRTGTRHYTLHLAADANELARLGREPVPGMPVEAYLLTTERSALSWLLKPVLDHFHRAFREN